MKPFEKIYAIVTTIPKGKVMTYQQVAKESGVNNPRIVGFAMRANKNTNTVPCHRVVGKNGKLTGYAFGGIKRKQEILKNEGITFLSTGFVDLNRCQLV